MESNMDNKKLANAIREEREAERKLAQCRRRVNELIGLIDEEAQRKSARKTLSREEFSRACNV